MDSSKPTMQGVTIAAPGSSSNYHVAPRTETSQHGTLPMSSPMMMMPVSDKKKRGRPRKYRPDEAVSGVMPNMSSSSSAPPASSSSYVFEGRPSVARPANSERKPRSKIGAEKLEDWVDCSTGSCFLPHIITVNAGEDISSKIMEFGLQGPRAVSILSGSGTVSTVTIRHPSSAGGTLTYEGLFEIISFSGSYTPPSDTPSSRFARPGTLAISLSGADGRVVGGLVAGLTVAATTVKVVVASFLLSSPNDPKPKKPKMMPKFQIEAASDPNGERKSSNSIPTDQNQSNWAIAQMGERSRKSTADINISLQG